MACPSCGCRDGETIHQRKTIWHGREIRMARVRCRHCGRIYPRQNEPEDVQEPSVDPPRQDPGPTHNPFL